MSVFYMPSTVLTTEHTLSQLIIEITPGDRWYYFFLFMGEEPETQRDEVT